MNRSELLDKLAMELDKWPSSKLSAYQVPYKLPNSAKWARSGGRFCVSSLTNQSFQINKDHWLQRRTELINCPPDSEAPSWAKWKLQGPTGRWHWSWGAKPIAIHIFSTDFEGWQTEPGGSEPSRKGAIIAGHDWRNTLTEVNHMEQPHEADARMLDAQLAADISAVNPSHYRAGKVECIEALASATINKRGIESICTANIIKYLWRYEQKNGVEDVRKAQWYLNRLLTELEQ